MPEKDTINQKRYRNNQALDLVHRGPYTLRVPVDKDPQPRPYRNVYDDEDDTLRIMPPEPNFKPPIQPLSLQEKKILHDFWIRQWKAFKEAPACQNVSEKRLREKFDSYISINIRRYLLKDWNNMFAGGYVFGEPEPREERESDDLRALTKKWAWLCKEMGFKPWPDATDDQNDNLQDVQIEVRNEPFGFFGKETRDSYTIGNGTDDQGGVVLTAEDTRATRQLNLTHNQVPMELVNINVRLMEAAQTHFQEMKAAHESDVANKQGMTRNHPFFDRQVFACMMEELREMEDQGCLSSDIARVVRALVIQDISS